MRAPEARGAPAWSALLAPLSACPGATDPHASAQVQRRAMACLVNWARARAGRRPLRARAALARAAALKGRALTACGRLTHAPCGADPAAPLHAAGYRPAAFAENLYAAWASSVTARRAMAAWLRSPSHRANILGPGFRHFGAALVQAPALEGRRDAVVWVGEFAAPR